MQTQNWILSEITMIYQKCLFPLKSEWIVPTISSFSDEYDISNSEAKALQNKAFSGITVHILCFLR